MHKVSKFCGFKDDEQKQAAKNAFVPWSLLNQKRELKKKVYLLQFLLYRDTYQGKEKEMRWITVELKSSTANILMRPIHTLFQTACSIS